MPKPTLPTLNQAARDALAAYRDQPDALGKRMDVLQSVLDNDSKRRSKRTKGTAGRKVSIDYGEMDRLIAADEFPTVIAAMLDCSVTAVRNRMRELNSGRAKRD